MKITVNVTQEDIDKGKRGSCADCPIALAAIRALGTDEVRVTSDAIYWMGLSVLRHAPIPEAGWMFIGGFDGGEKVHPFSFEIQPKDE